MLATGGIGGVHRGWESNPDVSGDLGELARTPAVVVCSGVKSLLDVPATVELLETLGIPVVGWKTDSLPLFYWAAGGPPLTDRVDSAAQAAAIARAHWALGGAAILLVQAAADRVRRRAADRGGARGRRRRGRSRRRGDAVRPGAAARAKPRRDARVNRDLIAANALTAGEVAVALAVS